MVVHPWLPNSPKEIKEEMLKVMNKSVDDLYSDIPSDLFLRRSLNVGLGRPLAEFEVKRIVDGLLDKNRLFKNPPPFLGGGGVCVHHVPSVVKEIIKRSEFLTTYTPYQAEISQGLLQALFEYQSLIADLVELEVVNASMYDWSTAVAEAFLMSIRVTKRNRILVPSTMNPEHYEVAKTITYGKGVKIEKVGYNRETGFMDLEDLENKLREGDVAAVYVENPSFLGFIEENVEAIGELAHKYGALYIVGVEPLSLGILKAPGSYGADIVVGEGQPLGLGLNYGGPLLGIFAVRWDRKLIRQMPGRLIGLTTTVDGKDRAFAMILQTREQHIRRERATSNITTNEALMAIAAAVYLSLLGKHGIRKLAEHILYKANYASKMLSKIPGVKAPLFKSKHFKEFTVGFTVEYSKLHEYLLSLGIHGGRYLKEFKEELGECALFCVTEVHSKEHIDKLINTIEEYMTLPER